MGKLEKLIAQLCPNGVPMVPISEIGTLTRGKRFVHADAVEEGIPCIHYGELYTYYGISTISTKSFVREELAEGLRYAHKNDVIIVGAGENDIDIGIAVAYLGEKAVAVHDACYILSHKCNPKYISYCLRTNDYHNQIKKYVSSGKICSISAEGIGKAIIPIPPRPIQDEIVCYLDELTRLTNGLVSSLNSEKVLRNQQLEYYRELLLDEGELVTLSDIACYSKERVAASLLSDDTYVGVENLLPNKAGKKTSERTPTEGNATKFSSGDILIGNIRPYLRKIWMADIDGGTNGDVLVIHNTNTGAISSEYLYYVLCSENFFDYDTKHSKGTKMPRGDKASVMKYSFRLPSLDRQHEIVNILNRLRQYYGSLSDGISFEIDARQRQYEFYRDNLLTFESN